MIENMVGTRRLELLTSTVSTPEFEVNRCTYKALVATKSPVGYGSSAYCDLNVPTQMPIVSILHNQSDLAAAGRNDCHLRSSSRADLVHRLRLPIRQTKQQSAGASRVFSFRDRDSRSRLRMRHKYPSRSSTVPQSPGRH
jgi:hypothetical protein